MHVRIYLDNCAHDYYPNEKYRTRASCPATSAWSPAMRSTRTLRLIMRVATRALSTRPHSKVPTSTELILVKKHFIDLIGVPVLCVPVGKAITEADTQA